MAPPMPLLLLQLSPELLLLLGTSLGTSLGVCCVTSPRSTRVDPTWGAGQGTGGRSG